MNFAGAASQKMKVLKEGGEKSLELVKLGKELVENCPPLLSTLVEVVASIGALASGDSGADEGANSLKDALISFKDAVKNLKDTTDQIKTVIKDLQELLGEDDAKDSKFGKVITKFLRIVDATANVLIKCGDLIEVADKVLGKVEGGQIDGDMMKKSLEEVTKCGGDVKVAVGELKDAVTGDNDDKKDKSKKEKEKPVKTKPVVDQPNNGKTGTKGNKTVSQGEDQEKDSGSCFGKCWSCCCCCCKSEDD